jgi:pyruvate/2-oxoglutarate dehydrogenase complex dihydrolipoamide acyltransferase (E2) component
MNAKTRPYHVVDLTQGRRVMLNMLDLAGQKHSMYGLLEVDVTAARQFIAAHKSRTGETLSFTGFLTLCLAHAVDENKEVQAYLKNRKQLMLFDDVDVGIMVEHKAGEKKALMGHVIRGAWPGGGEYCLEASCCGRPDRATGDAQPDGDV